MSHNAARLERHQAFLIRENTDRPLLACNVGFFMHQVFPSLCQSLPRGPITPDDIQVEPFLEDIEHLYQTYSQLGDDYPFVGVPFIYAPWMEGIMGCPIKAAETALHADPMIADWDAWDWERPALDRNPWAQKLLELMQALVEHSGGRYQVAHTQMRGPADMLSAMRGATHFPMDCLDHPDVVRRALAVCADVWIEVAKAQLALIPDSQSGYVGSGYWRVWTPRRNIWLQEDAGALLSPSLYRNLVLPEDRRIAREFPETALHLHGSMLWAIDDLVTVPEIDIIQLNHESARCDVEGTFAAWKKIQAHKPLVIWKEFDGAPFWPWLDRILTELLPAGLSLTIVVNDVEEGRAIKERIRA